MPCDWSERGILGHLYQRWISQRCVADSDSGEDARCNGVQLSLPYLLVLPVGAHVGHLLQCLLHGCAQPFSGRLSQHHHVVREHLAGQGEGTLMRPSAAMAPVSQSVVGCVHVAAVLRSHLNSFGFLYRTVALFLPVSPPAHLQLWLTRRSAQRTQPPRWPCKTPQ